MDELLNYLNMQSKVIPIGGGDINQAYRVNDGKQAYFLKYHPQMSADFFKLRLMVYPNWEMQCESPKYINTEAMRMQRIF